MNAVSRYSDRQVALFGVLGLVPWVLRDDCPATATATATAAPPRPPVPPDQADRPSASPPVSTGPISEQVDEPSAQPVSEPSARPVSLAGSPLPKASSSLGDWLAQQPLGTFARRGEQRVQTGPEQARVLVVAQAAPGPVSLLPIEDAESQLLELMLRAIGLAPGDWSTAVLAHPVRDGATGSGGAGGAEDAPSVQRLAADRQAVLWLARSPGDPSDVEVEAHRFRIAGVPAYRITHPARLLVEPSLKRQAWDVLKAVRNQLAGA